MRLNLNAPGDQMDAEGRLWLAWPRPVDPKKVYMIQQVPVQQEAETGGFRLNSDYHPIAGYADALAVHVRAERAR